MSEQEVKSIPRDFLFSLAFLYSRWENSKNVTAPSRDLIWGSIVAEAELYATASALLFVMAFSFRSLAEKEPILSSFQYGSILSHDCLERALAFMLVNKLQGPTLLATQLMDIFNDE